MPVPNPKWQPGTGKQKILKSDFVDIEDAILYQSSARMQPPLVWVDAGTIRVEATADCPVAMQFTGMPNIMNPFTQVDGGLSDSKEREISTNVSMIIAAAGLYGSEKASQWYAIFGIADDADTDFELKGMPIMRVESQAVQTIGLGTLADPSVGIGYGFTTDELVGSKVYFVTGASKGLMRTISANNNNDVAAGTITYSGDALAIAQDDWFIVFPPDKNFRFIGTFFNDSGSDIVEFRRQGDRVTVMEEVEILREEGAWDLKEDIRAACPFATSVRVTHPGPAMMGHPDVPEVTGVYGRVWAGSSGGAGLYATTDSPIVFCKYVNYENVAGAIYSVGYSYPPGTGF